MAWQAPDVLLAAISDIHGNLPALEAVLAELEREGVDELVCLGDVALGPQPAETVARVQGLGCAVVMGNWDAWVLEGFPPSTRRPMEALCRAGRVVGSKALGGQPRVLTHLRSEDRTPSSTVVLVLCFHGSPLSYDDVILATTPHNELLGMLEGFHQPLMLAGHTHVQLARVIDGRLIVNSGSVGLPFRGLPDGRAAAHFTLGRVRARAYRGQPDLGGASPHLL